MLAGVGVLVIISGLSGTDLLGEARADNPPCFPNGAGACLVRANPQTAPPPGRHIETFCQPAGMAGQHCFQRWVP